MRGKRARAMRLAAKIVAGGNQVPEAWKMLYRRLKRKARGMYR